MEERNAHLEIICRGCRKHYFLDVKANDYLDYLGWKHAQDAFPYLSPEERELLISGLCPECWHKTFGEEPLDL